MRALLLFGMASVMSLSLSAQAADNPAMEALEGSRYSWMTDGLDMQGGGTTVAEMMADSVIDRIQNRWHIQSNVMDTFKKILTDPVYRSAADELVRKGPNDYGAGFTLNLVRDLARNPVINVAFHDYGELNSTEELALSLEWGKHDYAYFERIYNAATDKNLAVLNLWRNATSPLEEQLKYSASYRYGID